MFNSNLSTVSRRWPDLAKKIVAQGNCTELTVAPLNAQCQTLLVNERQLTSAYDRIKEARVQCEAVPSTAKQAFVYGTALGDIQHELLKRSQLETLHVCILNYAIFATSLAHQTHAWLADPRVTLHDWNSLTDVYMPFVASPPELELAQTEAVKLRDRLLLELDHDYVISMHSQNNEKVMKAIAANRDIVAQDQGIETLAYPCANRITLIIAAGPSLEEHYDTLTQLSQSRCHPILIAVDVTIPVLNKLNITPDFVVYIDADNKNHFQTYDLSRFEHTTLVYFPRMAKANLLRWPGRRCCAYSEAAIYDAIRDDYPRASLFSGGSVIHPAVDLAVKLGATNIGLLGADFGFIKDKTHAMWQNNQLMATGMHAAEASVLNGFGEPIPTHSNFRGYLRELERYIEQHPDVSFFNTSRSGAHIDGAPVKNLMEAVDE
nr:6-hydroxymethylpterin diphosphokinase MptE-like protein [Motilimonas eburnea]